MKKAGGFYSNSLEMLLDTMCDMLGAVIFIALMVALVTQDSPTLKPAAYQAQVIQLSNDLAVIAVSNSMVELELQKTLLRLQDPHLHPATNKMRLPDIRQTTKKPWNVIVRYGKLYPLQILPSNGHGAPLRNNRSLVWPPQSVAAVPGMGDDPLRGIAEMAQAFKADGRTNVYFAFLVYDDSFAAYMTARDAAASLGFQYGWDPLPHDGQLRFGPQGEQILPQN